MSARGTPDPKYTVEIIAFLRGSDDEAKVAALVRGFGLAAKDARAAVGGAPHKVRRAADAVAARSTISKLLTLGATVRAKNEASGAEQTYTSAARSSIVLPGEGGASAAPREAAEAAASGVAVDHCASCSRVVAKGESCDFCGWSNQHGKRHCRECKKELSLESSLSTPLLGGFAVLGIVAGVLGLRAFGFLVGAAGVALAIGLGFVLDAATTRYRCAPCKRVIDATHLTAPEIKRRKVARAKFGAFGAFFVVLAVGLVVPSTERVSMIVDSIGMGWQVSLPRTHSTVAPTMTTLTTDFGSRRMVGRVATNDSRAIRSYQLLQLDVPSDAAAKLDDAAIDKLLRAAVSTAIPGAEVGAAAVVAGKLPGREARFSASADGAKLFGAARGHVFTKNVVVLVVVADSEPAAASADAIEYFDSLVTLTGS